ncbi:MAG: DUF3311 domain-containing protein [Nocardioidaceae bacterium]
MSDQARSAAGRRVWWLIAILLTPPVVFPLLVNTYAREEPSLAGFPFFYWYQFLWIPIAATLTFVAFKLVTSYERRRDDERREGDV